MKKTLALIFGSLLVMALVLGFGVYFTYKAFAPYMSQWTMNSDGTLGTTAELQPLPGMEGLFGERRERPLATMGDVEGNVSIQHAGATTMETAEDDTALSEGDTVMTDADSTAAIYWAGYGRTLLSTSTTVLVSKAERPTSDGIGAQLRLTTGRVWTRLEQVLSPGSTFEVRAANVVATVRGTSFGVGLLIPGKVRVQVAESNVTVARTASDTSDEIVGPAITMSAHEQMLADMKVLAMPKPQLMSEYDLNDPFIERGNTEVDFSSSMGTGDMGMFGLPTLWDGSRMPTEAELDQWYAMIQPYLGQMSAQERAEFEQGFAELRAQVRAQQ